MFRLSPSCYFFFFFVLLSCVAPSAGKLSQWGQIVCLSPSLALAMLCSGTSSGGSCCPPVLSTGALFNIHRGVQAITAPLIAGVKTEYSMPESASLASSVGSRGTSALHKRSGTPCLLWGSIRCLYARKGFGFELPLSSIHSAYIFALTRRWHRRSM